jgi:hypothetical protein
MLAAASADVAADLRVSRLDDPQPGGTFDALGCSLRVSSLRCGPRRGS